MFGNRLRTRRFKHKNVFYTNHLVTNRQRTVTVPSTDIPIIDFANLYLAAHNEPLLNIKPLDTLMDVIQEEVEYTTTTNNNEDVIEDPFAQDNIPANIEILESEEILTNDEEFQQTDSDNDDSQPNTDNPPSPTDNIILYVPDEPEPVGVPDEPEQDNAVENDDENSILQIIDPLPPQTLDDIYRQLQQNSSNDNDVLPNVSPNNQTQTTETPSQSTRKRNQEASTDIYKNKRANRGTDENIENIIRDVMDNPDALLIELETLLQEPQVNLDDQHNLMESYIYLISSPNPKKYSLILNILNDKIFSILQYYQLMLPDVIMKDDLKLIIGSYWSIYTYVYANYYNDLPLLKKARYTVQRMYNNSETKKQQYQGSGVEFYKGKPIQAFDLHLRYIYLAYSPAKHTITVYKVRFTNTQYPDTYIINESLTKAKFVISAKKLVRKNLSEVIKAYKYMLMREKHPQIKFYDVNLTTNLINFILAGGVIVYTNTNPYQDYFKRLNKIAISIIKKDNYTLDVYGNQKEFNNISRLTYQKSMSPTTIKYLTNIATQETQLVIPSYNETLK